MNESVISEQQVLEWLEEVKDPEIPVLSVVDLGVITNIKLSPSVVVTITPTFVGCPALDTMVREISETLSRRGVSDAEVKVSFDQLWHSDRISEKGRQALKKFGLAPPVPGSRVLFEDLGVLETAICPRCNGTNTILRNVFGATLCRSIHYCSDCHEAFEQFKPL